MRGIGEKMQMKCMCPFPVVHAIGYNAYKVSLRDELRMNSVFNVTDLSPFHGDNVIPIARMVLHKKLLQPLIRLTMFWTIKYLKTS